MSTDPNEIGKQHENLPMLMAYRLDDAVQGGTLIVSTLSSTRLSTLIKRCVETASYGWTQEDLLEALVRLDPTRIRVVRTYSAEEIDDEEGKDRSPLLFIDGRISINGTVKIDHYEETIQRLAETDSLAQSISAQVKKHKEEKDAKPKLDAKKIFVAEKLAEKSIEAKKVKSIEAVHVEPRQSVLDRTFKAVKKLAETKIL